MKHRHLCVWILTMMIIPSIYAQGLKEQVKDEVENAIQIGGIEKAVEMIRQYQEQYPDSTQIILTPVLQTAAGMFQKGERGTAVELLEKSKPFFPNQAGIYAVLGQFYWYERNRDKCVENFRKTLEIDPKNKTASNYMDLLFFVPEDFKVPELLRTKHMRIRPLRASDVELDYRAVMSSRDHIRGVFGPDDDWPKDDLTIEDDLRALKNHEDEHDKRTAFTYTVMDQQEKECLGCVYFIPIHAEGYDVQIFFWVTTEAFKKGYDKELYDAVKKWVKKDWPFARVVYPGRDIDWDTYAKIQQ